MQNVDDSDAGHEDLVVLAMVGFRVGLEELEQPIFNVDNRFAVSTVYLLQAIVQSVRVQKTECCDARRPW